MRKLPLLFFALFTFACSQKQSEAPPPAPPSQVSRESFGVTTDGNAVNLYTLKNGQMEVAITNYGGRVVSLKVPDRTGAMGDVVLGFDSLKGYLETNPYFGAIVGRYGNRIANGRFTLDGKNYVLARNNGPNALHGGEKGFDKVIWAAKEISGTDPALELTYISKDGEEGYPGTLTTVVTYTLTTDHALKIDYKLSTDQPTIANVTNHSYFNLKGDGDILGHEIQILADRFTPVNAALIPNGELRSVKNTPFDFTTMTSIGARIDDSDAQIKFGGGYDHNYVFDSAKDSPVKRVEVYEPSTGRVMEVSTTEPGVQFYTGNFLDGSLTGKGGRVYAKRTGFCLETQHFPNSPNQKDFPSVVVRPGEDRKSTTIYKFSSR